MTDTPETDANDEAWQYNMQYDTFSSLMDDPIPWDEFARKLERERDEAREERDSLHELHNKNAVRSKELLELCGTLREQRDAMRDEARKYIQLWQEATKELETLKFGSANTTPNPLMHCSKCGELRGHSHPCDQPTNQTTMKTEEQIIEFLRDIFYEVDSDIAYGLFDCPEDEETAELAEETIARLVNITKEFLGDNSLSSPPPQPTNQNG